MYRLYYQPYDLWIPHQVRDDYMRVVYYYRMHNSNVVLIYVKNGE